MKAMNGPFRWPHTSQPTPLRAVEMRQAWCSSPICDGGAKVGADCPPAWLTCAFCGEHLTFVEPKAARPTSVRKSGGDDA